MASLEIREAVCCAGRSLFERRYTHGTTGNISIRLDDGWLFTPTNASLGDLKPDRLAHVAFDGRHLGGDQPTKEAFLHKAVYEARGDARAIVHLHSTHSVALSCLCEIDPKNVLPSLTAYYAMRVGRLPLVPFDLPGSESLAASVAQCAQDHHAMLLAHHGPIVAGRTLAEAMAATEELEETARLFFLLQGHAHRSLTPEQVARIADAFPR